MAKITEFIKKYIYILFAAIPLALPDIILRYLVHPSDLQNLWRYTANGFSILWIVFILWLCCTVLPKKTGKTAYGIIAVLFNTLFFSNYIYYGIFGQFFWLDSIALAGEATDYGSYIIEHIDALLISVTVIDIITIICALIFWHPVKLKHKWTKAFAAIPLALIIVFHWGIISKTNTKYDLNTWDSWQIPTNVYYNFSDSLRSMDLSGMYQYAFRNAYRICFKSDKVNEDDLDYTEEFFNSKQISDNGFTGLFEGKNVIAVMMESIDDWLIDEKYTPTLYMMKEKGIDFTNHYATMFGAGYTFNTEFAFNTGFHSAASGRSITSFSKNEFPYSLPNLFKEKGYSVNSFHFNYPEFYNRASMHLAFGYESYTSFFDYMPPEKAEQDSQVLLNDEIYSLMTKKDKPFYDFVITYSGHIPYSGDESSKLNASREMYKDLYDPSEPNEVANLRLLAKDTDEFFRILIERLTKDGLMEDTVIVAFTDHYAYGMSDKELLNSLNIEAGSAINEKVPFIIYAPGIEAIDINKVSNTQDILPTLVNLFGLEKHNCYIGNDIFDDNYSGYVYFADNNWFDGEYRFKGDADAYPVEVHDRIKETNIKMQQIKSINDIVLSTDYFKYRK